MKTIEAVSIWDNGTLQEAKVLNAYAVNVVLGNSATFYYQLLAETPEGQLSNQLAQGNLSMSGDDYSAWDVDTFAWDWIAGQLNLVITGDYVAPVVEPIAEIVPEEVSEEILEEQVVEEEVING